jgi:alkanesulfonate monooxygenase SsuD/methylene tetrahydromethanopterin reductase-like flavin-dependent oxidoreductase (luciferase family)
MEEYMAAMELLWTERTASYSGKYVQLSDVETLPKPVQRPLPVFRAGHGEPVGVTEMCVIFYSPNIHAVEEQTRLFAKQVIANW